MPREQRRIKKLHKTSAKNPKLLVKPLLSGVNFVIVFIVLGLIGTFIAYAKTQIANNPFSTTPTPAVKSASTRVVDSPTPTSTIDPNPIITCNIHASCGGGSKQMRKSVCDSMNCCLIDKRCGGPKFITKSECNNSFCCLLNDGTGVLLSSKSACDNYYPSNNATNSPSTNNTYTYTPPTYYTCTLYYPALHTSSTYTMLYKTKEECDAEQAILNQSGSSNQAPLPQPTFDVNAYNTQVQQCRSGVINKYDPLIRGCQIQFGDSSATEACTTIYQQDRQREYNACGQTQ